MERAQVSKLPDYRPWRRAKQLQLIPDQLVHVSTWNMHAASGLQTNLTLADESLTCFLHDWEHKKDGILQPRRRSVSKGSGNG